MPLAEFCVHKMGARGVSQPPSTRETPIPKTASFPSDQGKHGNFRLTQESTRRHTHTQAPRVSATSLKRQHQSQQDKKRHRSRQTQTVSKQEQENDAIAKTHETFQNKDDCPNTTHSRFCWNTSVWFEAFHVFAVVLDQKKLLHQTIHS